jgi:hypothetical protein
VGTGVETGVVGFGIIAAGVDAVILGIRPNLLPFSAFLQVL